MVAMMISMLMVLAPLSFVLTYYICSFYANVNDYFHFLSPVIIGTYGQGLYNKVQTAGKVTAIVVNVTIPVTSR